MSPAAAAGCVGCTTHSCDGDTADTHLLLIVWDGNVSLWPGSCVAGGGGVRGYLDTSFQTAEECGDADHSH